MRHVTDMWMSHVTCVNESCMPHIWMSHVTCMNESCCTYEWVMSHMWMSYATHVNESCHACEWVMSQDGQDSEEEDDDFTARSRFESEQSSQGTCHMWHKHTHTCIQTQMSLVTHENESYHIRKWVMLRIQLTHCICEFTTCSRLESEQYSQGTCHICKQVMSHMQTSHVTYVNESCHAYN